jgi:Winged helix-turn helix
VGWRRVDLRDELKTQFGVEVHERTVGKYLAELGYRRLSVRPQHPDSDPVAQEAFKKTSPKSSAQRSPKKPPAKLSKSGSRTKLASASKAPRPASVPSADHGQEHHATSAIPGPICSVQPVLQLPKRQPSWFPRPMSQA